MVESEDAQRISWCLREALVQSVKNLQSSCRYGDHLWLDYVYEFGHAKYRGDGSWEVPRDPHTYADAFLAQFIPYVANRVQRLSRMDTFSPKKKRRFLKIAEPPRVEIRNLVFMVGNEVLEGTQNCFVQPVALPLGYIVHSNVAVGMMLQAFESGQLEALSKVTFAHDCEITCIHFEGGFMTWPARRNTSPHVNRMDNINAVLRQFGMDAHATQQVTGAYVRSSFNPRLKSFIAVGQYSPSGRCCFHIDPSQLARGLIAQKRKVLCDSNLVHQVFMARHGAHNGIETWTSSATCCIEDEILNYYDLNAEDSLVVCLTPFGERLDGTLRDMPKDIWFVKED